MLNAVMVFATPARAIEKVLSHESFCLAQYVIKASTRHFGAKKCEFFTKIHANKWAGVCVVV
jgi:hypothetical protein